MRNQYGMRRVRRMALGIGLVAGGFSTGCLPKVGNFTGNALAGATLAKGPEGGTTTGVVTAPEPLTQVLRTMTTAAAVAGSVGPLAKAPTRGDTVLPSQDTRSGGTTIPQMAALQKERADLLGILSTRLTDAHRALAENRLALVEKQIGELESLLGIG